MSFLFSLCE